MFCPNCGKNIADGSAFCPECGGAVKTVTPVQTVNSAPVVNNSVDTPVEGKFIDKCKAKIEGYLPNDKKKRNYVLIGLAVAMVLVFVFSYLSFTSLEGRWEFEYRTRGENVTSASELDDKQEVEFAGGTICAYSNGHKEHSEPYTEDGDYIIMDGDRVRYDCNGFTLKVFEDEDEMYSYSRVWEFGFILKMLIFIAILVILGFATFTVYKSNKLYTASVDTSGYTA